MERCKLLTSPDSFSKEVVPYPHGGKKRRIMCVILQVYLAIRNYIRIFVAEIATL